MTVDDTRRLVLELLGLGLGGALEPGHFRQGGIALGFNRLRVGDGRSRGLTALRQCFPGPSDGLGH